MAKDGTVIASGNLATNRRTISGVLGQLALLGIDPRNGVKLLTSAGLPRRALEEPDFPISLQQELTVCTALATSLGTDRSPAVVLFNAMPRMGIENLGVLGMAMRHAPTAIEALRTCLIYPQLTWGHSRMVVSRQDGASLFAFGMERPRLRDSTEEQIDRVVDYCLALDLVSALRNIQDILASDQPPLFIDFPFPQPPDWNTLQRQPPCPVRFSAKAACFAFAGTLDDSPLPHANPLLYRSYTSIAKNLSQMLADDSLISERVTRWLWAYTPPPRRAEIAQLMSMSERSLTRQLGREGTSYIELLAHVQQERAKNFLRDPALSVAEIGYRLGYTEPAAFSRAFTRWTGIAPLRWRRSTAAGKRS